MTVWMRVGLAALVIAVMVLGARAIWDRGPQMVLAVEGDAEAISRALTILTARQTALAMPPRARHDETTGTIVLDLGGPVPTQEAIEILSRRGLVAIYAAAGTGVGGDCSDGVPEGAICLTHAAEDTTPVALVEQPVLEGDLVEDISVVDLGGAPLINVVLTADARAGLAKLTADQIGRVIALTIDDVIASAPIIRAPIETGKLTFSVASPEIARSLQVLLSHPPLPINVTRIVSEDDR